MKGSSVGQKLKRNVRENNRIFTLKQRRSVRWSQERVVMVTHASSERTIIETLSVLAPPKCWIWCYYCITFIQQIVR